MNSGHQGISFDPLDFEAIPLIVDFLRPIAFQLTLPQLEAIVSLVLTFCGQSRTSDVASFRQMRILSTRRSPELFRAKSRSRCTHSFRFREPACSVQRSLATRRPGCFGSRKLQRSKPGMIRSKSEAKPTVTQSGRPSHLSHFLMIVIISSSSRACVKPTLCGWCFTLLP